MSNSNTSTDVEPCCFIAILECTIWPFVCVGLGVLLGGAFGVLITLFVFLFTAVWAPFRICKLMRVTITTDECFRGPLGPILRVAVFLYVPIFPILHLIWVTLLCATIGTLFCIGKTTEMFFKHEYGTTMKMFQTELEDYVHRCRDLLVHDDESHTSIYCGKATMAIIPGLLVATLVVIPYALVILGITIYRLPINLFKTYKIALMTVMLRWDLRLVVLVTLPLIHVLFPILTFICALFGCFFGTWFITSENVFLGNHPVQVMEKLNASLIDYHDIHKEFVDVRCHRYDHPSGIPDGWDGRIYGIAVARVLRWQRDLLLCCGLVVLEIPVCLIATMSISIIKYIPSCLSIWKDYVRESCCTCSMLVCWPFLLLGFFLLPVGVLILHLVLLVVAPVRVPIQIALTYLKHDDNWLWEAWQVQWDIICFHDESTGPCVLCDSTVQRREQERRRHRDRPHSEQAASSQPNNAWDRLQLQCIRTTTMLLGEGYITKDQVDDMDPSVIQSIPSVAIWTVIIDSVSSQDLGRDDIIWKVDGTICRRRHIKDPIAQHMWPMVMDLKRFVHITRKDSLSSGNVEGMTALLCANAQLETPKVKSLLNGIDAEKKALNNTIRVKITELVLALLRVQPYQVRMEKIFTQEYHLSPDPDLSFSLSNNDGEAMDIQTRLYANNEVSDETRDTNDNDNYRSI